MILRREAPAAIKAIKQKLWYVFEPITTKTQHVEKMYIFDTNENFVLALRPLDTSDSPYFKHEDVE